MRTSQIWERPRDAIDYYLLRTSEFREKARDYLEQKLIGRSRVSAETFSAELSSGKFEAGRVAHLDAAMPVGEKGKHF